MNEILGFFTSQYRDSKRSVNSLGGSVYSQITENTKGEIFSPVNEFDSTNNSIDYRIIYIKNIARKNGVVVQSPRLYIDHLYQNKQEILGIQDVYRIGLRIFVPTYINVNEEHSKIFTNGEFLDSSKVLGELAFSNTNPRYYGKSVFLDFVNLKTGDFFPIILERTISSPVPFIYNFSFKLGAKYTVTLE